MEGTSLVISLFALAVSGYTAWYSLLRRGTLQMIQPSVVFFGPDGPSGDPKVYLRALLYSTGKRGQYVESMYVRLRRGESIQNFNIWVYGNEHPVRGSGLFVGEEGTAYNHHFLLPKDGTHFQFLAGVYDFDVYAKIVGRDTSLQVRSLRLVVTSEHTEAMKTKGAGLFFDWSPDAKSYSVNVAIRPPFQVI